MRLQSVISCMLSVLILIALSSCNGGRRTAVSSANAAISSGSQYNSGSLSSALVSSSSTSSAMSTSQIGSKNGNTGSKAVTPANHSVLYQIYVAPNGNDGSGDGSVGNPFATIQKARDYIETIASKMTQDITVYIRGGTYTQTAPIAFGTKDSGQNGHSVIYKSYNNEQAVISGGKKVANWSVYSGSIWKASLDVNSVRSMYVNGVTAYRAQSQSFFTGSYYDPNNDKSYEGILVDKSKIKNYTNPSDVVIRWVAGWRDIQLPATDIQSVDGTHYAILFDPDLYNSALGAALASWKPTPSSKMYLVNAMEELDQPGEFYYNRSQKTIYYIPRSGENLSTANVVVPVLGGNVIDVKGDSTAGRVTNHVFDNLTVSHGTWNSPLTDGWANIQEQDSISCSELCPPGLISLEYAQNVKVQNCFLQDTASVGLRVYNDAVNCEFAGNVIKDTGDSAIVVGNVSHVNVKSGVGVCTGNKIENNLITRAGELNYGMPGISAYYVDSLQIQNNDISDLPYTGISIGYGWASQPNSTTCKNNSILNNKIYNIVQKCSDGGGIYTLGQQPNSAIKGNYISNQTNIYSGIYLDEGTQHYTVQNNVCENVPSWLYMKGADNNATQNYATTATVNEQSVTGTVHYDPAILFTAGSYPADAQTIISAAGLTGSYKSLLQYK